MRLRASFACLRGPALGRAALALTATAIVSLAPPPAAAQLFFEPFAYRFQYPPQDHDQDPPMRPREAADAARAQGFEPIGRPTLNREVYVVDAEDRAGRPVRLIMDAYEGEILRVMPRADGRRGRLDAGPGRDRGGAPTVIEGVGPGEDTALRPRPRRETQAPPQSRAPKREAAAPPNAEPTTPRPSARTASRPAAQPAPKSTPDAAASAIPAPPTVAVARPTPPLPPVVTPAPSPEFTEAAGPIPSPPFASGAYSKPPAPKASAAPVATIPPVAPLDEVKPQVKASPAVPPAALE